MLKTRKQKQTTKNHITITIVSNNCVIPRALKCINCSSLSHNVKEKIDESIEPNSSPSWMKLWSMMDIFVQETFKEDEFVMLDKCSGIIELINCLLKLHSGICI